jgi:uncharacterized protein YciI
MKSTAASILALGILALAPALAAAGTPPSSAPAAPAATAPAAPAPEPEFQREPDQFVVLQRPANPTEYPKERIDEIQREHLAHLGAMARAGKMVVAGPFGDQPDPKWRGLCLYRVGSLDEARQLAEQDPAVKAGRLEVVVFTWYTEKGALAFPMAERMVKEAQQAQQ